MSVPSHFSPFLGGARCQRPLGKKSLLTALLPGTLWTQPKESAVRAPGGCAAAAAVADSGGHGGGPRLSMKYRPLHLALPANRPPVQKEGICLSCLP